MVERRRTGCLPTVVLISCTALAVRIGLKEVATGLSFLAKGTMTIYGVVMVPA